MICISRTLNSPFNEGLTNHVAAMSVRDTGVCRMTYPPKVKVTKWASPSLDVNQLTICCELHSRSRSVAATGHSTHLGVQLIVTLITDVLWHVICECSDVLFVITTAKLSFSQAYGCCWHQTSTSCRAL